MADEPIYGREALRRFRNHRAAAEPTAPPDHDPGAKPKSKRRQNQMRTAVDLNEQSILEELARGANLTLSNYVRTALGMPAIDAGRPTAEQEARREEWVRRKRAELAGKK
jgi:hypothetical protein